MKRITKFILAGISIVSYETQRTISLADQSQLKFIGGHDVLYNLEFLPVTLKE